MDCYRLILGLRAVRGYRPEPVPSETVDRILEAGRWTGSANNRQPWTFIVVEDPVVRDRLARCGGYAGHLAAAPLVIVPVRHPDGSDLDMGRLMQNMMLAAAVDGVGSCPVTLHREEEARDVLGIPSDHGSRWAIAFGLPDPEAEARARRAVRRVLVGRARKPREVLVHRDGWEA